jgi:hypothetical protein
MCGDDGKKVTPVPISNTEVKLLSADCSEGFPFVRLGRCRAFFFEIKRIKNYISESPCAVMMARRSHLFPSRTQKLSFLAPIVVKGFPL